jgi:prevent-host-death family protein
MGMKKISIPDLKARLSTAVAEAESGGTIIITRHNHPVAQLSPARPQNLHTGTRAGTGRLRPAVKRGTKGRYLTLDLCDSNVLPAVTTPRSLDLAHLRTALWCAATEPIDRFVTMDDTQQQAARELGLPV